MRWIITVECEAEDGKKSITTLGIINRPSGGTVTENVGVSLQEAKEIVHRLQEAVVEQQLHEHCEQERKCSNCGTLRPLKDYRRRRLDTILGTVQLRAPRYHGCKNCAGPGLSSPISELLLERTAPELRHLQVSLGARRFPIAKPPSCYTNFYHPRAEPITLPREAASWPWANASTKRFSGQSQRIEYLTSPRSRW